MIEIEGRIREVEEIVATLYVHNIYWMLADNKMEMLLSVAFLPWFDPVLRSCLTCV